MRRRERGKGQRGGERESEHHVILLVEYTCTHTPHRHKTAKEMFPPQTQEGKANILVAEKDNLNPKSHICPEKG